MSLSPGKKPLERVHGSAQDRKTRHGTSRPLFFSPPPARRLVLSPSTFPSFFFSTCETRATIHLHSPPPLRVRGTHLRFLFPVHEQQQAGQARKNTTGNGIGPLTQGYRRAQTDALWANSHGRARCSVDEAGVRWQWVWCGGWCLQRSLKRWFDWSGV